MTETFVRLKSIRHAAMEQFQRGHFDFDHKLYEGLKSKYPDEAEQIKQLCLQSLQSSQELTKIEEEVEALQSRVESEPSQAAEIDTLSHGLEDEYYQHLKEMNWAIVFDIYTDGSTSVRAIDSVSPDDAHDDSKPILSEYIFHPAPGDWLEEESQHSRTASVDMSWMDKVLKVKEPGINVETPYGKVFVHPKKGRRYIKKNDGIIESLPRFLLSLNGVDLPKGTDIHHKDEDKLNDTIDNYQYDEHHDHAREHMNLKKEKAFSDFCSVDELVKFSSVEELHGVRGGYIIDVTRGSERYQLKTDTGVRGKDIPCIVIYNNGVFELGDDTTPAHIVNVIKMASKDNPADYLSGNTNTPYYQNQSKGIGTGKGKDVNITEIPEDELEAGMQTEMEEHNVSPEDGLAIALDHEAESIDLIGEAEYYKYLPNIETMIKNDEKNKK